MDTNLTSYYQKRLDELSSDTESQMEYMLAAAPYIDKLYSLTETAAPDANFPLAIKVNGKEQELFEDYMEFVEGKPNQQRYVDRNRRWNYCPTCDDEMVDMGSSVMVCTICGLSTSYICGDLTYKEEQEIEKNIVYSYKTV